jgi:hypothetical protein
MHTDKHTSVISYKETSPSSREIQNVHYRKEELLLVRAQERYKIIFITDVLSVVVPMSGEYES